MRRQHLGSIILLSVAATACSAGAKESGGPATSRAFRVNAVPSGAVQPFRADSNRVPIIARLPAALERRIVGMGKVSVD